MVPELAREKGITRDMHKLRVGMFGGEGHTAEMRQQIERVWGIECTENYGLTEVQGPGVSGECLEHCGLHINEDFFIPEIIDPATGEVLPAGERGELVITCIKKDALPLIRYRTKDITRLFYEPCKCGRTFCRMENPSGRSDDMLKIRGVNVFPSQIEEVILSFNELGPHYEIIVTREGYNDKLEIRVELTKSTDSFKVLQDLTVNIRNKLKIILGLAQLSP